LRPAVVGVWERFSVDHGRTPLAGSSSFIAPDPHAGSGGGRGRRSSIRRRMSVKGGDNLNMAMIRDLGHVFDREKAKIRLAEPTAPEAIKAGFYETDYGKFPKIQLLTIANLFAGKKPQLPWRDPGAFRKAAREDANAGKQPRLLL
jgi:hypothetical protein